MFLLELVIGVFEFVSSVCHDVVPTNNKMPINIWYIMTFLLTIFLCLISITSLFFFYKFLNIF